MIQTADEDFSSIVQVPDSAASVDAIAEFAQTFDAYGVHGSLDRISLVAFRVWEACADGSLADCALDDLRTALFLTQSGWHRDEASTDLYDGVVWDLVEAIRVASGGLVRDDRPILL
jgi:hypothetical protein